MRLREMVFVRNRLHLNLTADEEGLQRLTGAAGGMVDALPAGYPPGRLAGTSIRRAEHIGIAIPAQVCYVTKVLAAPPYRDPLSACPLRPGETTVQRLSLPAYPGSGRGLRRLLPV